MRAGEEVTLARAYGYRLAFDVLEIRQPLRCSILDVANQILVRARTCGRWPAISASGLASVGT